MHPCGSRCLFKQSLSICPDNTTAQNVSCKIYFRRLMTLHGTCAQVCRTQTGILSFCHENERNFFRKGSAFTYSL